MLIQLFYILVSISALSIIGFLCWKNSRSHKHICELEESLEDLGKVLKHRADLVNEIAHEIKNPITAMLCSVGTLDLLLQDSLDDSNKQTLGYMKECGNHILSMVSDFIDVSRSEGGTLIAKPKNTPIIETIESVVGLLKSSALAKKITIHIIKTDNDIYAYVDDKHLKQVIFNLVHNAIKFTPDQGEIEIKVKQDPNLDIIKIAVQDSGDGIPQEFLDSIFDLYSRYDGNQPNKDVGVGLGLALCKSLIELAGGEITVESEIGEGTTFEFTVPKAETEIKVINQELPIITENRPLIGQCFLLVDQDESSRNSIASLIEAWGGLVDQVDSAREAIQAISEYEYDAVVVDKTTDCIDPDRVAKELQEQITPDYTTLILARDSEAEELEPETDSEKVKRLAKPFNGEKLLNTLLRSGKFEVSH